VQSSVRVARGKPRPRDRFEGLAGRLEVRLRACSKELGDPVDSYLHVGTGALMLAIDEARLRQRAAAARSRRQLERLVSELSGELQLDYAQFSALAGRPAVPGSSVKGNVRSRLELSLIPKDGVVRCCLIRASEEPLEPPPPGEHGWRHFRIWEQALGFEREPACSYTEEEGQVCLCCDLFGTAGLQGLVEFSDFLGENVRIKRVDLPTGEKLEAAEPGSAFAGRISFRNLKPWELGLLLYGMGLRDSRIGRPVLFGKVKYRRYPGLVFGVVRYEVAALELAPFSQPLEAGGARVEPGSKVEGEALDGLVRALVEAARAELDGELLDVDEVGKLERLAA